MSHRGTEDRWIADNIFNEFNLEGVTVSDFGAGLGGTGFNVKGYWGYGRGTPYLIGYEKYDPYCDHLEALGLHDEIVRGDATQVKIRETDISILQQFVEHLEKMEALDLLERIEAKTRELILISTPLGFSSSDPGRHGNPGSEHKSWWYIPELQDMGYQTHYIPGNNLGKKVNKILGLSRLIITGRVWSPGWIVAWKSWDLKR